MKYLALIIFIINCYSIESISNKTKTTLSKGTNHLEYVNKLDEKYKKLILVSSIGASISGSILGFMTPVHLFHWGFPGTIVTSAVLFSGFVSILITASVKRIYIKKYKKSILSIPISINYTQNNYLISFNFKF